MVGRIQVFLYSLFFFFNFLIVRRGAAGSPLWEWALHRLQATCHPFLPHRQWAPLPLDLFVAMGPIARSTRQGPRLLLSKLCFFSLLSTEKSWLLQSSLHDLFILYLSRLWKILPRVNFELNVKNITVLFMYNFFI